MAGKAKAMSQIKQLLHLHKQGESIKSIACTLGISKDTLKSYLIKLATGKLAVTELLALEDPVLESEFHAGNPVYKDPRFEHLSDNLEICRKQLGQVCVTRKLLWQEYIADYQQG